MEMYNLELPNIPTSKGTYDNGISLNSIGYIHGVALLKDSSVLVAKLSPGRHSIVHISQDGKEKMLRLELNEIAAPRIFAIIIRKP
jgi:hypothetical protein